MAVGNSSGCVDTSTAASRKPASVTLAPWIVIGEPVPSAMSVPPHLDVVVQRQRTVAAKDAQRIRERIGRERNVLQTAAERRLQQGRQVALAAGIQPVAQHDIGRGDRLRSGGRRIESRQPQFVLQKRQRFARLTAIGDDHASAQRAIVRAAGQPAGFEVARVTLQMVGRAGIVRPQLEPAEQVDWSLDPRGELEKDVAVGPLVDRQRLQQRPGWRRRLQTAASQLHDRPHLMHGATAGWLGSLA